MRSDFFLRKVESARNSIQAGDNSIDLTHVKKGGLSLRLQDVDEDELLKAYQWPINKQCSDTIPT